MKKLSLVLVTLVAVSCMMLTSCKKDKLDGTTWKATQTEESVTVEMTLTFDDGNFELTAAAMGMTQTVSGTYTYADPTVTLSVNNTENGVTTTETTTGTVKGSSLELKVDEGVTITFTKQK